MLNPFSVSEVDHLPDPLPAPARGGVLPLPRPHPGRAGILTAVMGYFALQLRMDAGFEKQMPVGHEYIQTFDKYRDDVLGANRLNGGGAARQGTSGPAGLDAPVRGDPGRDVPAQRRPPGRAVAVDAQRVRQRDHRGGLSRRSADPGHHHAGGPHEEIHRRHPARRQPGRLRRLAGRARPDQRDDRRRAQRVRQAEGKTSSTTSPTTACSRPCAPSSRMPQFEVQIIGFAKQIGDIADGASAVLEFCAIALLLTALAVYWYCRSCASPCCRSSAR
jgi:hypothetical protein